ncbi:uncharacterized protein N7469_007951 [Penicillium citrinum]|uniref:WSC domain-containing protein n=2 Tax=Penicillium TaxID=5073 RepID=A0A9W9TIZ3_PENCI|nr:uncharacterized protein N7469_007951 [Penicillium citrinum]KAJ5224448.1 hypothetical protein N7469_007951 [Penicillium citrinum]KAJ5574700.1 hypothetical protein N7450_008599 [Penicillium hetheringtonii]
MRFTTETVLSLLLVVGSVSAKSFHHMAIHRRSGGSFVGCFSSKGSLGDSTSYTFQSTGWCSDHCSGKSKSVYAMTGGSDCLCGDSTPPSSDKVSNSKCDTDCQGFPDDKCGGDGFYSVYSFSDSDSSSSSSSTTTTGDSSATKTQAAAESVSTQPGGHTVIVTAAAKSTSTGDDNSKGGGTNTAAIAAGVVVGVVGVAALAGGGFFFYRSRKQKAEGGAGTSFSRDTHQQMSDSRFDGSYMAQRRQSNGSIDDDHDFSRRILQVTNPDHR